MAVCVESEPITLQLHGMLLADPFSGNHGGIARSFLGLTVVHACIGVISLATGLLDGKRRLRTVYPKTPTPIRSTLFGQG